MSRSRQLAAIMFTDIVGYTALMQQNEKKAVQTRNKHRRIFNSTTETYKGKILQYYGDGTLSIFDSAISAVKCAIEMQISFLKDPEIPVRIGIHSGDIIVNDEEIIGDSVNVTSRIESLAEPGSVFISEKVYDEIKNQSNIHTIFLKSYKLKNVAQPIKVYAISNEGLVIPPQDDGEPEPDHTTSSDNQAQPKSASPVLATKLYMPPPRSEIVNRIRLIEQLNRGLNGKLTLISAPAGFGKTTLASQWLSNRKNQVAWLSLDENDNDPIRFLNYLIATLQSISETLGKGSLALLQVPEPPPAESILTNLINDIAKVPDKFILVLDDYHTIKSESIDGLLTYLLDHLPAQMHLVMTTREDPEISLPRLRVRNQITEIRPADLRFTSEEAAGFLNQVMGLNLSTENINILETRTEGWVAGLQLAALSIQGQTDIPSFIKSFAGDDRYIVDYLVEEVLQSQTDHVHNFLLQTSVLNRLCGSLCDAVTGRNDSKSTLETLERGNLFIVPLDDKRQWFRYHHLFAEVLHAHLMEEQPDQIPALHKRASEWYEHNGSPSDSIRHALAAEDFERAAGLVELAWPTMDRSYHPTTWLDWAKALPDELVRTRPVLCVGYAWALLDIGELEAGEARLRDAERWLETPADRSIRSEFLSTEMVVVDEEQFRSLPATIATAHAYIAQSLDDVQGTVKYAQQALDLLPEEDRHLREVAASLLALAYWSSGDLEAAYQTFASFMENMRIAGNIPWAIGPTFILADIRIAQGRLHEAVSMYEQSLKLVAEQGEPALRGTAELYLGLSELHYELDNKETARQHMLRSEELGEQAGLPDWQFRRCLALARINEAQGDWNGALNMLHEAERLYYRSPLPDWRPIAALKTRVWIKQSRLTGALDWAHERGLSVDDELRYLREFEHITLARVLIARYNDDKVEGSIHETMELLERLLKAAEEGGRMGSVLEILILQALAREAQGNIVQALASLERALTLAEPEGYVRIFVDEGIPMARLLSEAAAHGILPDYTGKLLAVLKADEQKQ